MNWDEAVRWISKDRCGCNEDEYAWMFQEIMSGPGQQGDIVLEIGSWRGASTLIMAAAAQERGMHVYTMDTFMLGVLWDESPQAPIYEANRFSVFEANVQRLINCGLRPYVSILNDSSLRFGAMFKPQVPVSFLWIDGNHIFPMAVNEWKLYSSWIRPGGVIGVHDCQDLTEAGRSVQELHDTGQLEGWTEIALPALNTPCRQNTILQHTGGWWTRAWRKN